MHSLMCEIRTEELITDISAHVIIEYTKQDKRARIHPFISLGNILEWKNQVYYRVSLLLFFWKTHYIASHLSADCDELICCTHCKVCFELFRAKHLNSSSNSAYTKVTLAVIYYARRHLSVYKHKWRPREKGITHLGDPWGFDTGLAVDVRFCSIRW